MLSLPFHLLVSWLLCLVHPLAVFEVGDEFCYLYLVQLLWDAALVRFVLGSSALLKLLLLSHMSRWTDRGWNETLGDESGNFIFLTL